MAEIIKTFPINLDLKRVTAQSTPISPLVVGDNGNIFEITLTDGGVPVDLTGCKVLAVFSRPDGQTVEQDTDGNGVTIGGTSNNVLTIEVRTGSYSDGKNDCELQIYSGTEYETLVTSAQFNFDGRRGIMNEETLPADDNYPILVELISQTTEAAENAAEAASQVATSAAAAQQAAADAEQAVKDAQEAVEAAVAATVEVGTVTTGEPGTQASVTNSGTKNAAVLDFTIPRGDPAEAQHAAQHAAGGSDPVTPAAIGAIPATEKGSASGVASLNANGKVAAAQTSAEQTAETASFTLALEDAGKLMRVNASSAVTITIPTNAGVAFPPNTEIEFVQFGNGALTFSGANGVSIYSLDGALTTAGKYAVACLKKIYTDVWLLSGALV